MDIDYIREFIHLAKKLNFAQTAEEMFITQSSLSRHIIKIELELGVDLLYRSPHRVILTESGKQALTHFEQIINTYEKMLYELEISFSGLNGSIKIGMLYYAIDIYYAPMLNHYKKHHPDIKLRLFSYQPSSVIRGLIDKTIEVGLLFKGNYEQYENVEFHTISQEKTVLMYSEDNLKLKGKSSIRVNDLRDEIFVFVEDFSWMNPQVLSCLKSKNFIPQNTVTTEQVDTLPLDIMETNGVSIVNAHLASGLPKKGICYMEIEDFDLILDICLVTLKDMSNSFVNDYIEHTKKYLQLNPYKFTNCRE